MLFTIYELTYKLSVETNSQISPFLRLPAELRNKVYRYVYEGLEVSIQKSDLSSGRVAVLEPRDEFWTPSLWPNVHFESVLSTTLICRQWYHESYLLPFQLTLFHINDKSMNLNDWLTRLEETRKNSIRTVHMQGKWGSTKNFSKMKENDLQALLDCPGLKRVIVTRPILDYYQEMIEKMTKTRGIGFELVGNEISTCQMM